MENIPEDFLKTYFNLKDALPKPGDRIEILCYIPNNYSIYKGIVKERSHNKIVLNSQGATNVTVMNGKETYNGKAISTDNNQIIYWKYINYGGKKTIKTKRKKRTKKVY